MGSWGDRECGRDEPAMSALGGSCVVRYTRSRKASQKKFTLPLFCAAWIAKRRAATIAYRLELATSTDRHPT